MAGFSSTAKDDALSTLATNFTFLSLHSADPGTTGASEISGGSYARVATTWSSPATSSMPGSQVIINVPATTTVSYWGLWSAITGGTWCTGGQLPGAQTFTIAGTLPLTPTLTAAG